MSFSLARNCEFNQYWRLDNDAKRRTSLWKANTELEGLIDCQHGMLTETGNGWSRHSLFSSCIRVWRHTRIRVCL